MKNEDVNISSTSLANLLGVTGKTVRELARRGVVVRAGRDNYARDQSVQQYCAHLRELIASRGGETAIANATTERARLLKAQADAAEIKNEIARKEVMSAAEVTNGWSSILRHVRSGILATPGRVACRLPHLTRHDIAELDTELRAVLTEMGNTEL